MAVFFSVYGAVALAVFALFMAPLVPDWGDYSAKEVRGCALFAACVGLIWPFAAAALVAVACCGAYYAWKDGCSADDEY